MHMSDETGKSDSLQAYREYWKKLAGSHVDEMLKTADAAEMHLAHVDPNVRIAALFAMTDYWKPTPSFVTTCERIAFNDPDLKVRRIALHVLGRCYDATNNERIGRLLASLVRDELQPKVCREAAYNTLFAVADRPIDLWPTMRLVERKGFHFPDDVDWAFVDSFFGQRQTIDRIAARTAWMADRFPRLPEYLRASMASFTLGMDAVKNQQYEDAVYHFTETIRRWPENAVPYFERALVYRKLCKFQNAIADFTTVISLKPDSAECHQERSKTYRLMGLDQLADQDEAIAQTLARADKKGLR